MAKCPVLGILVLYWLGSLVGFQLTAWYIDVLAETDISAVVHIFDRDLGYQLHTAVSLLLPWSDYVFDHWNSARCLSTSGTPSSSMIQSFSLMWFAWWPSVVSCLVAVEKLPDDALSKQALLIEFKKGWRVSWRKTPFIVSSCNFDPTCINNFKYYLTHPLCTFWMSEFRLL